MVRHTMDLDTPAALIEAPLLDRNLRRMQALADRHGVFLRAHIKTHKIPELAKRQLMHGAVGIAVAKLGEAEIMAAKGIRDIQIANIIVGEAKILRLRRLAAICRLSVAVDSVENAIELSRAFRRFRTPLAVLIKVNTGLSRCGLDSLGQIRRFITLVADLPGISIIGLMTHAGHVYAARNRQEVKSIGHSEGATLVDYARHLRDDEHDLRVVSVGSTPTAPYCAKVKGVTELRVGVYVFNDMTQVSLGAANARHCALTVLASVISTPSPDRVIIDAGAKALGLDKGAHGREVLQGHGRIVGGGGIITRLSEEHGIIEQPSKRFRIGRKIRIIPNHACSVMNLFDDAYLVEGDTVLRRWVIAARGKMQ